MPDDKLATTNLNSADKLRLITEVASGNAPLTESAKQAIASVLHQHEDHFKTVLIGLARHRARRVSRMLDYIDQIEAEFEQRINTQQASTHELIQFYRQLSDNLKDTVELMQMVLELGKPGAGSITFNFGDTVVGDKFEARVSDKDSREKIRNALGILIEKARGLTIDGNSGTPISGQ